MHTINSRYYYVLLDTIRYHELVYDVVVLDT